MPAVVCVTWHDNFGSILVLYKLHQIKYISNNVFNNWCVQHQDRAITAGFPCRLFLAILSLAKSWIEENHYLQTN